MIAYTGVGSRRTPTDVQQMLAMLGLELQRRGYVLRSGGAMGADQAFASLVTRREIYRPEDSTPAAYETARALHPAWGRLSHYARVLHARNCFQVLGRDLASPSAFVVCWTPDGAEHERECTIETGGTATAIRLASRRGIPVFNTARADATGRLMRSLPPR